jgi:hypothetical protein
MPTANRCAELLETSAAGFIENLSQSVVEIDDKISRDHSARITIVA